MPAEKELWGQDKCNLKGRKRKKKGKKERSHAERETLPHSAAWKVETGHEEEETSLRGWWCGIKSDPEGV